ncbi:MAG TPA: transketolase C-terminal domain-containing protein [Ilumatobacter sp.]|nr:transketolase C-terminal domain-containing protein [Ilumatobacter sp.]
MTLAVTIDGSAGKHNARAVYGEALVELAAQHPEVVALTADLMLSHQLKRFHDAHPERFFNVGIAEQDLMGVSAGLAIDGKVPFATTFAAFASMRAHEQVRTDIAYPSLPVKIVGTMGGLSGGTAGPTHSGLEDLGVMRMMPGMTVIAPSDPIHLSQFVQQAYDTPGPVYIRLGRGEDPIIYPAGHQVRIGEAVTAADGDDVTIVCTGVMLRHALAAAARLAADGIGTRVLDMHTVKPLDTAAIAGAAEETGRIVTVEDHLVTGGLGSAVAECVAELGAPCRVVRLGIPDLFSIIGPPAELYREHGYDETGIERAARRLVDDAV